MFFQAIKEKFKREKKVKETHPSFSLLTICLLVFLCVYVVILLTPFAWALLTSFKSQADFRTNILGLPKEWVWNYEFVLDNFYLRRSTANGTVIIDMYEMIWNSVLYSVGCGFFRTLSPFITAYMCARYKYKFSRFVHSLVLVIMTIPIVGTAVSEITILQKMNLYDNIFAMWFLAFNFLGSNFLIFYGAAKGIPESYSEAAKIDGASHLTIMLRIVFPLIINIFGAFFLMNIIGYWNDYASAMLYIPSYPTLAVGMFHIRETNINGLSTMPMRLTGAMILLIPVFTLFIIFQGKMLGNLTIGGLKG